MGLFAEGGVRGTPLSAIAERIGVTAPAITHHFGSKDALLREVVARTDGLQEKVLDIPEDADGLARISANRRWATVLVSNPELANLLRLNTVLTLEALDPGSPMHEQFVRRIDGFRRQLSRVVKAGVADGSIRPDVDPRTVAAEVISFMHGAQLQWFLIPRGLDLPATFEAYFDRLVADLSPKPARSARRSGSRGAQGRRAPSPRKKS